MLTSRFTGVGSGMSAAATVSPILNAVTSPFAGLRRKRPTAEETAAAAAAAAGVAAAAEEGEDEEGDDDTEGHAEEENDEDDGPKKGKKNKKTKKSKAEDEEDDESAEDEDEDEPEARVSAADIARIRASERKRIRKILASDAASVKQHLAVHLAVNTATPAAEAIGYLEAAIADEQSSPAGTARDTARERLVRTPAPNVGPDSGPQDTESVDAQAQRILAAGRKARGETA